MQRSAGVQRSLFSDGDRFDMWHDYMNLGSLLPRLRSSRGEDRGDAPPPPQEPPAPWADIHASPRGETPSIGSPETSSASSLSDGSTSGAPVDYCRFCKQNGESSRVYGSHRLKSDQGKVCCPVLRKYTCPVCGATGDSAHTRRYCPVTLGQGGAALLHRAKF
ncbi:nanos homolog 2-like [Pholidichthys leucotaenia]